MADSVDINGVAWSYPNTRLAIDSERYSGYNNIEWSHKRTSELGYGATTAFMPNWVTLGKYEPGDLKISLREDSWKILRATLAGKSRSGTSYGDPRVRYPIVLMLTDEDLGSEVITFNQCWVKDPSGKIEQSEKAIYRTITFGFFNIDEDGTTLNDVDAG